MDVELSCANLLRKNPFISLPTLVVNGFLSIEL